MPVTAASIQEARRRGFSDDQIANSVIRIDPVLGPRFQKAIQSGYSTSSILDTLSRQPATSQTSTAPVVSQTRAQGGSLLSRIGSAAGKALNVASKPFQFLVEGTAAGLRPAVENVVGATMARPVQRQLGEQDAKVGESARKLVEVAQRQQNPEIKQRLLQAAVNLTRGQAQQPGLSEILPSTEKTIPQVAGDYAAAAATLYSPKALPGAGQITGAGGLTRAGLIQAAKSVLPAGIAGATYAGGSAIGRGESAPDVIAQTATGGALGTAASGLLQTAGYGLQRLFGRGGANVRPPELAVNDQQKVDPAFVRSRLTDIAGKVDEAVTGVRKPTDQLTSAAAKEILKISPDGIDSPGQFYTIVAKKLRSLGVADDRVLAGLRQTTQDFFLPLKDVGGDTTIYKPTPEVPAAPPPTPGAPAAARAAEPALPFLSETKPRSFIQTLKGGGKIPEEVATQIGDSRYTPTTNAETVAAANQRISELGVDRVEADLLRNRKLQRLDIVTGERLVDELSRSGETQRAADLAEHLAENLTRAGQTVQAASIYSKLSPEGVLVYAQKQIQKYNASKLFPGLRGLNKLDPADAQRLSDLARQAQEATDPAIQREMQLELAGALNEVTPASFGRKLSSAQTIAQLLNPKTIIRNLVGNEAFWRVDRANQTFVATPIDWVRSKLTGGERQITFRTAGEQEGYWSSFFQGARQGASGVAPRGTQFDIRPSAFKSRLNPLYWGEKATGASLRGFDEAAYQRAYQKAYGEQAYLRAYNEGMRGTALTEAANRYAGEYDENIHRIADEYGRYVTFQDDNVISQGLAKVKSGLNFGQDFGVGDLALKYPRTPGALLMRGIEYSPAGFAKSAYEVSQPFLTGKPVNVREAELALSRAITGSLGFTGLGYYLADKGIITGRPSDDKDVNALQRSIGLGRYQVNMSALQRWVTSGFQDGATVRRAGDRMVTYDWLQPVAMAVSLGANANQNVQESRKIAAGDLLRDAPGVVASSLEGSVNTLAEQPVLSGLTRLFQGYSVVDSLGQTLQSLPASFTPTLLNQIRQVGDNASRETYDPAYLQRAVNQVANKIPGLSESLPQRLDAFGQPVEVYQNGGNQWYNVFLNPAFTSTYEPTPEAQMVLDLYEATGETKQFPRITDRTTSFTIPGQQPVKVELTPDQIQKYQRISGVLAQRAFRTIAASPAYRELNPDQQIYVLYSALNTVGSVVKPIMLVDFIRANPEVVGGASPSAPR